jgi:hypothetical protein
MEMAKTVMVWTQSESAMAEGCMEMAKTVMVWRTEMMKIGAMEGCHRK